MRYRLFITLFKHVVSTTAVNVLSSEMRRKGLVRINSDSFFKQDEPADLCNSDPVRSEFLGYLGEPHTSNG
jgi:hypothetical protein